MSTHHKGSEIEVKALNALIVFFRAYETINSKLNSEILSYNITEPQFGVLEVLFHLGPQLQHNLADKLLVSGGNITFLVDKLEKTGFVKRTVRRGDRRCKEVSLLPEGIAFIKNIFPSHANFILCRIQNGNGLQVYEELAKRGVFVRHYNNQYLRDYIRVSVGLPEDNSILVQALKEIL